MCIFDILLCLLAHIEDWAIFTCAEHVLKRGVRFWLGCKVLGE